LQLDSLAGVAFIFLSCMFLPDFFAKRELEKF